MLKIIHIILAALLAYVAWLQLNDPDPLFWTTLYLLAAAVPLTELIEKPFKAKFYFLGLAVGFCLAGITLVFSGALGYLEHIGQESIVQDMSPDKPYIEETRELLGTLFALIVVAAYSWIDWKKSQQQN